MVWRNGIYPCPSSACGPWLCHRPAKITMQSEFKVTDFFYLQAAYGLPWSDSHASGAQTSPFSKRPKRRSAWLASRNSFPSRRLSLTSSSHPREKSLWSSAKNYIQLLISTLPAGTTHNKGTKPVKRIVFWNMREGPWIPTLRLLQRYPSLLPTLLTDAKCPKFILRGAQMMAPGIHQMDLDLQQGAIVSVSIRDAPPFFIGRLVQAGREIMAEGRHKQAVETLNIIGDGFWEYGDDYK
ncbi:MCT-1 protein-like protein [Giardia duodenalis assemblage B]|uniref:MCT-1 protein-like protein n=1 Tax=Giardia duodenalis assemblage B TaxID=1394984 RepID=A0A132NXB5_GIAIN|nr:MCT-1 protein-like protein [Giardia intestinalis assemblage B]